MTGYAVYAVISIHAPAKGATRTCFPNGSYFAYFNPRSREGSDCLSGGHTINCFNFNPRSREGSDDLPTRMARRFGNFNPRSREGSDLIKMVEFQQKRISIHAPAKGATQSRCVIFLKAKYFNPRSREGSDPFFRIIHKPFIRFQSTLPRRERPVPFCFKPAISSISIHAPAKGATLVIPYLSRSRQISIHAPAKGATE